MSQAKESKSHVAFLEPLEEKVRAAGEALRALREENRKLAARVEELEEAASSAEDSTDSNAWETERQEIRERVERLTGRLESLLEDDDA